MYCFIPNGVRGTSGMCMSVAFGLPDETRIVMCAASGLPDEINALMGLTDVLLFAYFMRFSLHMNLRCTHFEFRWM